MADRYGPRDRGRSDAPGRSYGRRAQPRREPPSDAYATGAGSQRDSGDDPPRTRPRSPLYIPALAGKIALTLVAALVMSMAGYSWAVLHGMADGVAVTDVLGDSAGGDKPADGSRDILVVGMDSRTDVNGNPLSKEQRKLVRAGSDDGETNTDTLILLHVPNDGSKAVGISLPRDSYVDVPGYGKHKINSAYTRAKTVKTRELKEQGVTDKREIEQQSNQAGAKTLIATVEKLTGRTIDNYAAVNLLGFYDITKAVGGVEVCLKNDVSDVKSHAEFEAGRQNIDGTDALAFVRQRNGLPRGDLDRVTRQQVFMTSMVRKILSAGTLSNPGKLRDLIEAVKKSVVLNEGWDLVGFAEQMSGLSGGQFQVQTIPVERLDLPTPSDGMAVEVDPEKVREFITGLSGDGDDGDQSPESPQSDAGNGVTVNVLNAAGADGLADDVADELGQEGYDKGRVDNADQRTTTVVRHAPGEEDDAQQVAQSLQVDTEVEPDPAHESGQVTVLIGTDYPTAGGAVSGGGGSPAAQQQQPPPDDEQPAPGPEQPAPDPGQEPVPDNGEQPAEDGGGGAEDPELNDDEPLTAGEEVPCVN